MYVVVVTATTLLLKQCARVHDWASNGYLWGGRTHLSSWLFSLLRCKMSLILPKRLYGITPPPPIVVDREPEWEVEEILDSHWHWRRFQFLIKWKGFSREHNSWEVASNVKTPDLVIEYYWKYPAAPRHIHQMDFNTLFKSRTITSRCSNLGGR